MKYFQALLLQWAMILPCIGLSAQDTVRVEVDFNGQPVRVSPFLYGRNNSLSDNPQQPTSETQWQRLRDAGVTLLRESGGNNSTKYNWRKKMTSHPDWYNNVYAHDWDYAAASLQQNLPAAQGMWTFQLIGRVASDNQHNFNDWEFNQSKWWDGVRQNLAGGGIPNTAGGDKALTEGNLELYTEPWPADSVTGILHHWFEELTLDSSRLRYWNMDNEVEIWSGTHDDVMPVLIQAEAFISRYVETAKKARQAFPGIRLVGPVPANEWQWYNWNNQAVSYKGKSYCWLEYFIMRIAEEQNSSGIRLLDVLDIHFYPFSTTTSELVQYHRVYFDKSYTFPEANGVKRVNGGWEESIQKEYIFSRCSEWLEEYMGSGHGVKFGVTEAGINEVTANTTAIWYASTLGEFMKNGVELFTPWTWLKGMWEVLHLYARYNKSAYIPAHSSNELYVSAYPTLNTREDSLSVVLVNRSANQSHNVELICSGFHFYPGEQDVLQIHQLPAQETFVSHASNALKKSRVVVQDSSFAITLPAMSITTVLLFGSTGILTGNPKRTGNRSELVIYPNPAQQDDLIFVHSVANSPEEIWICDMTGKQLGRYQPEADASGRVVIDLGRCRISPGMYCIICKSGRTVSTARLCITNQSSSSVLQ